MQTHYTQEDNVCCHSMTAIIMKSILYLCCSGTSLRRTPLGPPVLSITERVSSGQLFIIHYVGYVLGFIIEG